MDSRYSGRTPGALRGAIESTIPLILILSVLAAAVSSIGAPQERLVVNTLVNLTAVLGLGVFTGSTGILSFGHLAFAGFAAYLGGILTMSPETKATALPNLPEVLATAELSLFGALVVAVLATTVVGALVGLPIARAGGTAAIIMTLGVLVIGQVVLIGAKDLTRGNQVFYGVPQSATVWSTFSLAALSLLIARWYKYSRLGLMARAARDDHDAARASGVSPERTRLVSWTLSVAMSAAAGVMVAHSLGALAPSEFSFPRMFALIAMLIVGGLTSVTGAVAGVILVSSALEALRVVEAQGFGLGGQIQVVGLTTFGLAVLLLAVMYLRKEGLLGDRELEVRWLPTRQGR